MDTGPAGAPPATRKTKVRWRDTLYARATMFLLLGGGALVGALVAMSSSLVDDSVERLLVERLDLARTVGGLLDRRISAELDHLADHLAPLMARGPDETTDIREALAAAYPTTIFREGAIVLSKQGEPTLSLPGPVEPLADVVDLAALSRSALAAKGTTVSPLARLSVGDRPVLVALAPIRDPDDALLGFVGGVLQPTATDLLQDIREIRGAAETDLELVDVRGVVVASTDPRALYRSGDHSHALEEAIAERRTLKGRCHSCHVEGERQLRDTEVMSFAPLPRLEMGLAVYQPEDAALAPAFDLRQQLTMVIAVIALFVLFLGFAVHSVVRPVVRLTRAVDALDAEGPAAADRALPSFGRDEVGTLARSLDLWRRRMHQAMGALDESREASRAKAEANRLHLEALEEIAAQSSMANDVETILRVGLRYILEAVQLDAGALRLVWEDNQYEVVSDLDPALASPLLDAAADIELDESTRRLTPAGTGRCAVDTTRSDLIEESTKSGLETLALSSLIAPHGLRIQAAMASKRRHDEVEERWIHSLFYHICMSATSRILRDREHERQRRQERYLRGVLNAQEEERRRIARDLHDTIAQDLAALRLDLERFGWQLKTPPAIEAVGALEARTAAILRTTRAILLDLRLTVLESMGFLSTLQWHLERLQREHGIRGVLSVDGEERTLDYYLSVALLRIFQECLNNVVQHAEAEQAFVTVSFGADAIGLEVEDDGRGFTSPSGSEHAGLGILGMRERARLLGGTLTIGSRAGEGTTVTVTVPARPTSEEIAP